MVEEGMAVSRFSPKNQKYKDEILIAEKQARDSKIGCKWETLVFKPEEEEEEIEIVSEPEEEEEKVENVTNKGYECGSNIYNCGDFKTHAEARAVFELCGGVGNDVHRLDRDKDGISCETLS